MEKTLISPQELRDGAAKARELDDLLDRAGRAGLLDLMGFDLPWLADRLEQAADGIEIR